ncbi:MAG: aminopeptidase, partial [Anaerolineae bacterium]|nr:aminopeptidase [Anaerolineae bacterium]
YHTPLDRFENLDLRSVQHQGESVLALAQELADTDLSAQAAGDAAWTDILGFVVVHWSASWTMPLAILALILLLVVSVVVILRTDLGLGGLLLGLLAVFLALVLTVLLGLGLTWLLSV